MTSEKVADEQIAKYVKVLQDIDKEKSKLGEGENFGVLPERTIINYDGTKSTFSAINLTSVGFNELKDGEEIPVFDLFSLVLTQKLGEKDCKHLEKKRDELQKRGQ